jgi:hypothetical protein
MEYDRSHLSLSRKAPRVSVSIVAGAQAPEVAQLACVTALNAACPKARLVQYADYGRICPLTETFHRRPRVLGPRAWAERIRSALCAWAMNLVIIN